MHIYAKILPFGTPEEGPVESHRLLELKKKEDIFFLHLTTLKVITACEILTFINIAKAQIKPQNVELKGY